MQAPRWPLRLRRLRLFKGAALVKSLRLFRPAISVRPAREERRGTRHDRGYDYQWAKSSEAFRRRHPICQECERVDIIVPVDVVDHKIPVSLRPDLRMDRKNWWSLCHHCHNGMKRKMEALAIKTGRVDELIAWCDDPTRRPEEMKRRRKRRQSENLMV